MLIGVPKEIKNHEYRVGLTPMAVAELVAAGHRVLVQTAAGAAIGFADDDYRMAGADIVDSASEVFATAELIVKVKEPQEQECQQLKPGQTLFTYLHLAPDHQQTRDLLASGATCIAYETVTDDAGHLPLLAPMSAVAGRMSVQAGACCLERSHGGRGVLLGGVPGVEPGRVVVIGGGVVGANATAMAVGLGADVVVLDKSVATLRCLDAHYGNRITTIYSTQGAIEQYVTGADLVIGAVLIPGAEAPKLISRALIGQMKTGSAIVDVAIDQGGCVETSHATTHDAPTFTVDGVVHYCVANMPGAVARTSTMALNNATLPFVMQLAGKGVRQALEDNAHLRNGLNIHQGQVTCRCVAEAQGLDYYSPTKIMESM